MSRGIWVLGAGLAVVGTGFVFSVVQTNRLSEQVRDLQRKAGEARVQVAAGEPRPAADGSEAADRLREDMAERSLPSLPFLIKRTSREGAESEGGKRKRNSTFTESRED